MAGAAGGGSESSRSLSGVRREFARWRRRRALGARIPETLWSAAVALVAEHGLSHTSRVLGLDYYALKKRVDGARATSRSRFVELELPPVAAPCATAGECQLELECGDGRRLRVELRGPAVAHAETLARALCEAVR